VQLAGVTDDEVVWVVVRVAVWVVVRVAVWVVVRGMTTLTGADDRGAGVVLAGAEVVRGADRAPAPAGGRAVPTPVGAGDPGWRVAVPDGDGPMGWGGITGPRGPTGPVGVARASGPVVVGITGPN